MLLRRRGPPDEADLPRFGVGYGVGGNREWRFP
jgi:hypothetical protein